MDHLNRGVAGEEICDGDRISGLRAHAPDEGLEAAMDQPRIERRSDMVVLPAQNTLIAKAPGLFRKMAERLGFKSADIVEAIALAERELTLT